MMIATITISIRDDAGDTGSTRFYIDLMDNDFSLPDDNIDFDFILEYISEIVTRLDACIYGVITGVNISWGLSLPAGLKTTPDSRADVYERARIKWQTEVRTITFTNSVPTWNHSQMDSEAVENFVMLIADSALALAWPPDIGRLCDARGVPLSKEYPTLTPVFRSSAK